ncbi:MAG TPA: hypothetical protein VFK97_01200 [Candidatus Saccharimonadales bacterium]|nr:hypothetical protein [Candidatus Saccharimonadales bacterium]
MPRLGNKKIIAVDIDEVLFPMVPDLIDYLDKKHQIKLTEADFKDYYFEKIWTGNPGEALEIFKQYRDQLGVTIAPVKGAKQAIHQLAKKYNIIVITSRDESLEKITRDWLNNHFPELFKEVHLIGESIHLHSLETADKTSICKRLGASYLIDDSFRHVADASREGIAGLLFGDYPWNQGSLPERATRVKGWHAVLEYFNGR